MALGADGADMRTGQFEGRIIMVECGRLPGSRGVAAFAGGAFSTSMHILGLVTGKAGGWRVIELGCRQVALGAQYSCMRSNQREHSAVVEGGRLPAGSGVAVLAGSAFSASMHIVLQVAAHAGHWSTLEDTIDMAGCARNSCVLSSQFESRQVVVKGGWFPGSGVMACAAGRAKRTSMGIILEMAGNAVHRGALEFARGGMALGAQHGGMGSN
jgi:hypothetical protein